MKSERTKQGYYADFRDIYQKSVIVRKCGLRKHVCVLPQLYWDGRRWMCGAFLNVNMAKKMIAALQAFVDEVER